ncbi:Bacteriophage TLS, TfmB [Comamonadaceae bacterium]
MGNSERSPHKKLIEAARYWAGADQPNAAPAIAVDDNVAQGLRRVGVSEEDIAKLTGAQEAAAQALDFEVYEDCWESVQFFLKVQTQWCWKTSGHSAGLGSLVFSEKAGLNYPAVESVMRMEMVPRRKQAALLADLREMELAVLAAEAEIAKNG